MDTGKSLTPKLKRVVNFFESRRGDVHSELILLTVLFRFAQITSHFRLQVVAPGVTDPSLKFFVNLYILAFARSGSGKSQSLKFTRELLLDDNLFRRMRAHAKQGYILDTNNYLKNIDANEPDENKMDDKEKGKVRRERMDQFSFMLESSTGTYEGFLNERIARQRANIGAFGLVDDEFADTLESNSTSKQEFMTGIKMAYGGDTPAKKIARRHGSYAEVKGVPNNAFTASAPDSITEGGGYDLIYKLFGRGMSRRRVVAHIVDKDVKAVDYTKYMPPSDLEIEEFDEVYIKDIAHTTFNEMEKKSYIGADSKRTGKKEFSTTLYMADIEAHTVLAKYVAFSENLSKQASISHEIAEADGRWMRALKIASIVAMIEHPEEYVIKSEDMQCAVEIVEHFSKQYMEFFKDINKPAFEIILDYLKESMGKPVTRTELVNAPGLGDRNYRISFLNQNLPILEEYMEIHPDYRLEVTQQGRATCYTLHESADIKALPIMQCDTPGRDYEVLKGAKEYSKIELPWDKLPELMTTRAYMPHLLVEGTTRGKKNYLPGGCLLMLDVDQDWTLKEAEAFLKDKGYKAILLTTASHQKTVDKSGEIIRPRDKFRIVMPLLHAFTGTTEEWTTAIALVMKHFENKPDDACKDTSRIFFPSPENAKIIFTEGEPIDLREFQEAPSKPHKTNSSIINQENNPDKIKKAWGTFIENEGMKGNRNNALFKLKKWAEDEGIKGSKLRGLIEEYNGKLSEPLDERELELTVLKGL